jgi:hypothetical protein
VQLDSLPDVSVRVRIGQPRRQRPVRRREQYIDQVGVLYRLDFQRTAIRADRRPADSLELRLRVQRGRRFCTGRSAE